MAVLLAYSAREQFYIPKSDMCTPKKPVTSQFHSEQAVYLQEPVLSTSRLQVFPDFSPFPFNFTAFSFDPRAEVPLFISLSCALGSQSGRTVSLRRLVSFYQWDIQESAFACFSLSIFDHGCYSGGVCSS